MNSLEFFLTLLACHSNEGTNVRLIPLLKREKFLFMKIAFYAGSWPQNIGNAFFDFGAEAITKKAFTGSDFYRTGGAVHWMFNNSRYSRRGKRISQIRSLTQHKPKINGNSIEIAGLIDADLVVFAGMSMCEEFVLHNGPTLKAAAKNGAKIIGLGAGASRYTYQEAAAFGDFFSELPNAAIITRDDDTFDMFKNRIGNIQRGIDCAFFLPDYFAAPRLISDKYNVLTFDFGSEPAEALSTDVQIFRTHHDLWGPLPDRYTNKPRTLVSDVPEDYLSLYANCEVTFSDRVHACIASLSSGNQARLYSSTPRKSLFTSVGVEEISHRQVRLEMDRLTELKMNQIEALKKVVESIV